MTKNLFSVSKFTTNNNVLIEFDSSGCLVKDKKSGRTLLRGRLKEGLYEFQNPKIRNVCSGNSSSRDMQYVFSASESIKKLWHQRLGHPSEKVLNQVLKNCNVQNKGNDEFFL